MKEFEQIINEAIAAAEKVDCDTDDFKVGLCTMWQTLNARIELEDVDPQDPDMLERTG